MMTTPIWDFVKKYNESNSIRLHMPGHKGMGALGCEGFDITEISGADSLFQADGIIKESESNASELFGAKTFYSTEGSSLSIRAMLYLYKLWAGKDAKIIAGRNAHKSFLSGIALLDISIEWLTQNGSYLSNTFSLDDLERALENTENHAVYITSPDYLGNIADIQEISKICKKHKAILLVDNAHGAYLKFLPESKHPIDLGADICCDSAHKTLPVLTGGAYLHISRKNEFFAEHAKDALSLFASTSPSMLILQSLDIANDTISQSEYKCGLRRMADKIISAKETIKALGYSLVGDEPLKITINAKPYGYDGYEFSKILENSGIYADFWEIDNIVLMLTSSNGEDAVDALLSVLKAIPKRTPIFKAPPKINIPKRAISPREAIFSDSEVINAEDSLGRIFAGFNIACPPAVPIVVCGETIDEKAIECFRYYGIKECRVIK